MAALTCARIFAQASGQESWPVCVQKPQVGYCTHCWHELYLPSARQPPPGDYCQGQLICQTSTWLHRRCWSEQSVAQWLPDGSGRYRTGILDIIGACKLSPRRLLNAAVRDRRHVVRMGRSSAPMTTVSEQQPDYPQKCPSDTVRSRSEPPWLARPIQSRPGAAPGGWHLPLE